jgi:hypothetical protein
MAKKITLIIAAILMMAMVSPVAYGAMALVWDSYTDPDADNLRIESATSDSGPWTQLGNDLATTVTSVAIVNGSPSTRVYYQVVAFNADGGSASNIVSYYWTTGGGGGTTLQSPAKVGFIDCSDENLDEADEAICTSLNL